MRKQESFADSARWEFIDAIIFLFLFYELIVFFLTSNFFFLQQLQQHFQKRTRRTVRCVKPGASIFSRRSHVWGRLLHSTDSWRFTCITFYLVPALLLLVLLESFLCRESVLLAMFAGRRCGSDWDRFGGSIFSRDQSAQCVEMESDETKMELLVWFCRFFCSLSVKQGWT